MNKPYIIVHMMSSIDGRIDCAMTAQLPGDHEYYQSLADLKARTRVSGRNTAQLEMNGGQLSHATGPAYGKEGFAKHSSADAFEVIVDTHGKLAWPAATAEGKPLLIVTSEDVAAAYLQELDQAGISWIATGKGHVDLTRAMAILAAEFGVARLAVVGGGKINGGFLAAGLVDEVSLLIGPGVDGRTGQPAVFDGLSSARPQSLTLKGVQSFKNGAVWLRYLTK